MRVRRVVVAVAGLIVGLAGVAPSAGAASASTRAETASLSDAVGDMGHPADIYWARMKHTRKAVVVRVQHASLPVHGSQSVSVFFDTDAGRDGAEFVLNGGLFLREGSGHQKFTLTHARGWASTGRVVNCEYAMSVDFDRGVSRLVAKRSCLGMPSRVRVGVRVEGETDAGVWRTDWAGGRHEWTPWLPSRASGRS